jgi:CRP-like cAMP-binding protein
VESTAIVGRLSQLALFADLRWAEVEAVAHMFEEEAFAAGQRVLRQGLSGSAFYIILDGEAVVVVDGRERRRLGRGDFFGEISALTGEPPSADVRAETLLRCLVIPGPQLEPFLLERPTVTLRMLRAEALRLRDTHAWEE